jgi:hypothetical protein
VTGIWLILEQHRALFLAAKIAAHLVPFSKGQIGNLSPCGVSLKKTVQFQGKLFTASFLQDIVAGPILGIDFLRKFKVTIVPEINQIQFACAAAASPTPFLPSAALPANPVFSAASSASPYLFSSPPVPALVPIQLPTATKTSSQLPAISTHVVRNPEVKSSSFSLLDPPPSYKKYLIQCLLDVKALMQKYLSISSHRGCEADTN